MKKELKRTWKKAVVGKLELLVLHVAGGTEEYYQTQWSGQPMSE
jgi:hypothetical protein